MFTSSQQYILYITTVYSQPYRRVVRQVQHTSSQVLQMAVRCCVLLSPPAPSSPPFRHVVGGKVPGAPAGGIPLTAEALSGMPCVGLGFPAEHTHLLILNHVAATDLFTTVTCMYMYCTLNAAVIEYTAAYTVNVQQIACGEC